MHESERLICPLELWEDPLTGTTLGLLLDPLGEPWMALLEMHALNTHVEYTRRLHTSNTHVEYTT